MSTELIKISPNFKSPRFKCFQAVRQLLHLLAQRDRLRSWLNSLHQYETNPQFQFVYVSFVLGHGQVCQSRSLSPFLASPVGHRYQHCPGRAPSNSQKTPSYHFRIQRFRIRVSLLPTLEVRPLHEQLDSVRPQL